MTARTIVERECHEHLEAFEETFSRLEGVTAEHVATLRKASTSTATRSYYPQSDDPLGQAAYIAAALRGLAEAVATLLGERSRRSHHSVIGGDGWEEIADYALEWAVENAKRPAA